MAGGSVTEKPDDDLVGGVRGLVGVIGVGRPDRRARTVQHLVVRVRRRGADLDLPARVRALHDRPLDGHEGHAVLHRVRARLWSFRKGETEYGVRALPLGAFVRIIGMNNLDEVPPEDEPRTYRSEELPAADARDHGRLDDAHADRDRAALRRVRHRRRDVKSRPTASQRPAGSGRQPAAAAGLRGGDMHRLHRRRAARQRPKTLGQDRPGQPAR